RPARRPRAGRREVPGLDVPGRAGQRPQGRPPRAGLQRAALSGSPGARRAAGHGLHQGGYRPHRLQHERRRPPAVDDVPVLQHAAPAPGRRRHGGVPRAAVMRGWLLSGAALALLAGGAALAAEGSTDQTLRFHQSRAATDPDDPLAHNRLATAYIRKARESGDLTYYGLAEQAAQRSLKLVERGPAAATATTLLAVVHVARHEFAEALRRAQAALELNPAELTPNAVAGDALAELGDYDEAARAY